MTTPAELYETHRELLDRAIEAFGAQRPDEALERLRTACGLDARLPPAALMLARLQLAAGRIAPRKPYSVTSSKSLPAGSARKSAAFVARISTAQS